MLNTKSSAISASWFYGIDGISLEDVVKDADVLVIHRSGYSSHLAELIRIAKRRGTTVLFDVDDLVFESSEVPILLNTLDVVNRTETHFEDQDWERWLGIAHSMRMAALSCDGIIATTEYLAKKAERYLSLPAVVLPNFLSDDQYKFSQDLYKAKINNEFSRDFFFDIGYFSGTPSHNRDFAIARGAIESFFEERDDARLTVVGFLDLPNYFLNKYEDRIRILPLTNYINLQLLISKVEVNIAPLQQNSFTHGKSELKFFDAAAVGVPTIASPTESMISAIDNGKSGILSRNQDWYEHLASLADNYSTIGIRIGQSAKKVASKTFTSNSQFSSVEKFFLNQIKR